MTDSNDSKASSIRWNTRMDEKLAYKMLSRLSPNSPKNKRIKDKEELLTVLRVSRVFYMADRFKNGPLFFECDSLNSLAFIANNPTEDMEVRLDALALLMTLCLGSTEEKSKNRAFAEESIMSLTGLLSSEDGKVQKQALMAISSIIDAEMKSSITSPSSSSVSPTQPSIFLSSIPLLLLKFAKLIHSPHIDSEQKIKILQMGLLLLRSSFSQTMLSSSSPSLPSSSSSSSSFIPSPLLDTATQSFLESVSLLSTIIKPHVEGKPLDPTKTKEIEEKIKKFEGSMAAYKDPSDSVALWSFAFGILEAVKKMQIPMREPSERGMDSGKIGIAFLDGYQSSGYLEFDGKNQIKKNQFNSTNNSFALNTLLSSCMYRLEILLKKMGSGNQHFFVGLTPQSKHSRFSTGNYWPGGVESSVGYNIHQGWNGASYGGSYSECAKPTLEVGDVFSLEVDFAKKTAIGAQNKKPFNYHFNNIPNDLYFVITFYDSPTFDVSLEKITSQSLQTSGSTALPWK